MKLKLVLLADRQKSLAVAYQQQWVPLIPALQHYDQKLTNRVELERAASDLLFFLKKREYQEQFQAILDSPAVKEHDFDSFFSQDSLLPFQPLSYRDFMLFEQHYINAAESMVKTFMPLKGKVLSLYEKWFKKKHRRLKPPPIWYEKPIYYMGNHLAFYPDQAEITFPGYARILDYELELGVLITRPLYNATPDQAQKAMGAFCILNDFSVRNVQLEEMSSGFGPVKAKNFANSISNVIVTADEILPSMNRLAARVLINNQVVAEGSTHNMQHSLSEALAYASCGEKIQAGEFIGSGTIPNCCGLENGRLLKHGDLISLEIEKIGTLSNRIKH